MDEGTFKLGIVGEKPEKMGKEIGGKRRRAREGRRGNISGGGKIGPRSLAG